MTKKEYNIQLLLEEFLRENAIQKFNSIIIEDNNNNFSKLVCNVRNKLKTYKRDDKCLREEFLLENEGLETIKVIDAIKLIHELDTDICQGCNCKMLFYDYEPYCFYQFSFRRIDNKKIHTLDNLRIICWNCSSYGVGNYKDNCSRGCHKKDERIDTIRKNTLETIQKYKNIQISK